MRIKRIITCLLLISIMLMAMECGNTSVSGNSNVNSSDNNKTSQAQSEAATEKNDKTTENKKNLIIYYSYTGTVQRIAEHLQQLTNGTLYELTLEDPYTGGSNEVSDRVFQERGDGKMPELSGELPDISQYDQILI